MDAALELALGAAYVIERPLGEGGMATVYLATDVKLGRRVALKVLRPTLAASVGADRFRREIRIAAGLTHPNILPLLDSADLGGGGDGPLFFAMPFVEGDTLRTRLSRGPLPIDEAVRIALEVAGALDYSHRRGIIHRDIKPENILLLEGHAVVTDFGIAHALGEAGGDTLTQTGIILGTPAYMSPEQIDGERTIDGQSDVFSLAAVLYEMLTGASAFGSSSPTATMARVAAGKVTPIGERRPDVPPALAEVVYRGLSVDRRTRFQAAREFSDALRSLQGFGTLAAVASYRRRLARYAIAVAIVVVALAGTLLSRRNTSHAADIPALAILPFATAPGDTANAYLGIGIAEQLLDALSDVPGLHVKSRTSSFALGPSPDIPEIGRRLGVAGVLEGSVSRRGSTVHVTARLIDPARDTPLWSQQYDEPIGGVADVQEAIARSIVDKLRVRLASDSTTIVHRRSRNAEAQDLVLRARYLVALPSTAGALAAVSLLARAEALDSTYAEVPATQAIAFQKLALLGDQDDVPGRRDLAAGDALRLARVAAERAVRLDSLSSTAHTALGALTFRYDWNWALAERELKRAVELNPTAAEAHRSYARYLRSMGRFEEARRMLDRAAVVERSPGAASQGYALIAYYAREFARSEREFRAADPTGDLLAERYADVLAELGRFSEADSLLVHHGRGDEAVMVPRRVYVLAHMGRTAEARELLRGGTALVTRNPIVFAAALGALGDTSAALDEIERAVRAHDPLVVDLAVDPRLDPLRTHPRFVRVINQLGLPKVR